MRLRGRVAVVTGAAGVFGRAITATLLREGASVLATDLDGDGLAEAMAKVRTEHGGAGGSGGSEAGGTPGAVAEFTADLTDQGQAEAVFDAAVERFGGLHVLVNNAGYAVRSPLRFHSAEDWHQVLRINLDSVFWCSRAAVRRMLPARDGRIVNISSVLGITGGADEIAYATAKAGVIGFTKSLAQEVGHRNVMVNAICPTLADSGVSREYFDGMPAQSGAVAAVLARRSAMPRPLDPTDVAHTTLFLASEEGAHLNGQALVLGGFRG